MSTTKLDKSIDCGTSACVQIKLNRSAWSDFLYKNIITIDGVLTLTPYNIRGYIDKLVKVRTPMCCENPDKPCATCDSQVLWTKDNSSPAHMNSHRRPTICHKLTALKMMTMRTAIMDMINYKPKPYIGVIVATSDDSKPEVPDGPTATEDNPIKAAWGNLTKAMVDDPDWAWSVHCNLAMPIMDTLNCSHKDANLTAAALMQHVFHYDITTHKCYQDIINRSVSLRSHQLMSVADQRKHEVDCLDSGINPWLLNDKLMAAWSSQLDQHRRATAILPEPAKIGTIVKQTLCTDDFNGVDIIRLGTTNNPVEETYIMNHLKPRESLSDKFDPDYAKFGIRNKYDLVRGKLIPVNPEIPFHQKVKEYFIENAYYSNDKYPWVLFMIGESLNNDSTLFKTIKVGNLGDMERTLIIPNDELNFDDFKLVWNPANEAIEETSATCDASDFLRDLTNRIKEHRSIGSEPCDKDCIVKGTEVNPIVAHREKVLSFFKHGMTYLKKQRDNFHYVYCDDLSSYKRFVFRCKSPDIRDGAFITFDLEDLDPNDWQHIDDATIEESNKLPPIETMMDPITSRIEQLNPETKESLLKFLEIRNFFKPNGVYSDNRSPIYVRYIYKAYQPRFDQLVFDRIGRNSVGEKSFSIYNTNLNNWDLVSMTSSSHIVHKESLCQKVKAFFKPGRIYCNPKGSFAGCCFEFYEIKESQFDIIRCKRHFFNNNPSEENTIVIDYIKFEDWTDMSDITTSFQEYNSKFLIPGHIYCKMDNHDVLRFERKIPSLQSKVILRFRRVPNNEIVEFSIDEFRRDDWQDITYKLYQ